MLTRTLLKFAVIGIFYSQVVFLNGLLLVLTAIVMQTCAYDNSSSTQDAPFSNTTSTGSFQTQKANGSCRLIFKVETDFFSGKTYLSFAVRENLKGRLDCQKISSENGPHTKMAYFCPFLNTKSESLYLLYPLTFRLKLKIQPSFSKSRA